MDYIPPKVAVEMVGEYICTSDRNPVQIGWYRCLVEEDDRIFQAYVRYGEDVWEAQWGTILFWMEI